MPDGASACPKLALCELTGHVSSCCELWEATKLDVSTGSPKAVPVPCASCASNPDASFVGSTFQADDSKSCCAAPFGAVRLALRPSCRTAMEIKQMSSFPYGVVCLIMSAPNASHRAYPLARASKVLHRPSAYHTSKHQPCQTGRNDGVRKHGYSCSLPKRSLPPTVRG